MTTTSSFPRRRESSGSVRLGDVLCDIQTGKSFLTSEVLARPDELAVLKVSAVSWSRFLPDEAKALTGEYEPAESHKVKHGDLLISRANTMELVGAAVLVDRDYPMRLLSDKTLRLVVDESRASKEYLLFALRSSQAREHIEHFATGTSDSMRNISQDTIKAIPLTLPPLDEQRRIAARLKAQLAEVEIARQAAQAQVRDAGLLRCRLLQMAFESLLSNHNRDARMKNVCAISAGGTPHRGNTAFFGGDIPWVKTLDLNFGLVTATEERISREAFAAIRGEMLPVGTVMVAMYGGAGTIGKSGILGIEACSNQAVCSLQPDRNRLSSKFLHEWICYIRPEWMRLSGGNRKDPNINKSIVENMTLPLPPIGEQRQFVQRLQSQLSEASVIAQAAAAQLAEIERLPQRLLAQAFDPSTPQGDVT